MPLILRLKLITATQSTRHDPLISGHQKGKGDLQENDFHPKTAPKQTRATH